MSRWIMALGALVIAIAAPAAAQKAGTAKPAPAQPAPATGDRATPLYFYMVDAAGNRLLLQTQFSLSNHEADVRALRRLQGVVAGLEQRGFRRSTSVSIGDWDKREKFAKCYIYLEDDEAGRGKSTGARVWCSESGISEAAVAPSDEPKHVEKVLERFGFFLAKAKEGLKN